MKQNPASFRDPSGTVYDDGKKIYRTIHSSYADDWKFVQESGLFAKAVQLGYMLPVKTVSCPEALSADDIYCTLQVDRIPFISYPYEWSFTQLQDAALLTLKMQQLALEYGCVLKDATAYNIQFMGSKPIFIDTLSFERWVGNKPWDAYKQFCSHFLAPLALEAYVDKRCGLLSRQWIDGIPLDIACAMLPFSAKFSFGLYMHLFLHSRMQQRHADARNSAEKVGKVQLSLQRMLDIVDSLQRTVQKLKTVAQQTEWDGYYEDTNYTSAAMQDKLDFVLACAQKYAHEEGIALDLGANTGRFSRLIAQKFSTVIAADIDSTAVDKHYLALKNTQQNNITPVIFDLTSPSPAIGWACTERGSFSGRVCPHMILALALCHHLYFTGGIPFTKIAEYFFSLLARD